MRANVLSVFVSVGNFHHGGCLAIGTNLHCLGSKETAIHPVKLLMKMGEVQDLNCFYCWNKATEVVEKEFIIGMNKKEYRHSLLQVPK